MPSSISRRFSSFGVLATVLLAMAALLAPASVATADDTNASDANASDVATVGVATRPAGEDGRPDGRTRFTYAADPGQSVTDRVLVGNTGTQRQDFTVYATDAFNADDGSFALLSTDETPSAAGAWVRFEDGSDRVRFSLAPDEVRLLSFTVAVPADATPGDHVGGLVASVIEDGQQVTLDRRVATPLYARVSGELQPRLSITSYDASYAGDWWNPFSGEMHVHYTVTNAGNVALAGNTTSGVGTWFGIPAAGEHGGSIPVLLPGSTAEYDLVVPGVGAWVALWPHTVLHPFVDSSDAAMQTPVTAVTRDTMVFAMPWALLIALAAVGVVLMIVRRRRRLAEARALEWVEYVERAEELDLVGAGHTERS